MAKYFSKSTETRDELSTINLMSRCLSSPDATSLHHCLKNKQIKTKMLSVVRIQQEECLVLCTVTSRFNVSIYCLPST